MHTTPHFFILCCFLIVCLLFVVFVVVVVVVVVVLDIQIVKGVDADQSSLSCFIKAVERKRIDCVTDNRHLLIFSSSYSHRKTSKTLVTGRVRYATGGKGYQYSLDD